jgi:NCAIR mutase (PurE)-related protein
MNKASLLELLAAVQSGTITPAAASQRLADMPYEDLGHARIDHHRSLRTGLPEVIYAQGKSPEQTTEIFTRMAAFGTDVTAELFNTRVTRLFDVGVAGLHRLLDVRDQLTNANAIIVCAGMEGALPSVVGGLVGVPVIAVPTSVGYGASFDGAAALLGMLNSCSPNVTVVNIDNGFGAAYTAVLIARAASSRS